jgi:iron complex transport system permease protein
MNSKKDIFLLVILAISILIGVSINLWIGAVEISVENIVAILSGEEVNNVAHSYILENRLNRSFVAIIGGGALAVSGLILQVYFRNPLAGPGVLGVTSGASLGVAVVVLGGASMASTIGVFGIIGAGSVGAISVLFLLLFLSKFIRNAVTLLVAGLMFGYFTAAIINILYLSANMADTRTFVIWGLGSFEGLNSQEIFTLFTGVLLLLLVAITLIKPLNALVLGMDYAKSVGIKTKQTKYLVILITGLLAALVTVYCGPIGFIGIAVPQLVRRITQSKNHLIILPVAFLGGSLLALLADIVVRASGSALPLNTVTALIGAPIIVWVIIKMNRRNVEL